MIRKGLVFRVTLLIFGSIIILGVIIASSVSVIQEKQTDIDQQLNKQRQLQYQANDLYVQFLLFNSEFRGFIAFGREEFLERTRKDQDQFLEKVHLFHQNISSERNELGDIRTESLKEIEGIEQIWPTYIQTLNKRIELKKIDNILEIERISQGQGTALVQKLKKHLSHVIVLQSSGLEVLTEKRKSLDQIANYLSLFILAGFIMTGILIVRFIKRSVIQPILEIEDTVYQISQGHYIVLDQKGRHDELGKLVQGINSMASDLQERQTQMEQSNRELADQRDLLEAQNEEIIAQQEEQHYTLEKLMNREQELAAIASYQENLTGIYEDLNSFLSQVIPALLRAVDQEGAILVVCDKVDRTEYHVVYSTGYPENDFPRIEAELFGASQRVLIEKQPVFKHRALTSKEQGLHSGYETAYDQYYPLFDRNNQKEAFLLLTDYGPFKRDKNQDRLTGGLIRQFELAFFAQLTNEERRTQAYRLAELNQALLVEKKFLQEQRDITNSILESSHEGMVMCDTMGNIVFTNQRMLDFFGYESLIEMNIAQLSRSLQEVISRGNDVCEQIENLLKGTIKTLQERFSFKNEYDEVIHFEMYANPIMDEENGQYRGYLFVYRNRTESKKADELKNEFVSIVSHELRTPLASVIGFIEILLHRELPQEKQTKYMQTIYKEAMRLSNLINDFLDLQRMESGSQEYHFIPINLAQWVLEQKEQWKETKSHQINLHVPNEDLYVLADANRLTQVLANLVSNAIKYSPGAEQIDLYVRIMEEHVYIEVQDYGLGIPEEVHDKLFSKFYRVDNSDRRQIGGTGLGLAISKEIVDAHQGKLSFDSTFGQGSTFTIQLPMYEIPRIERQIVILEDNDNLAGMVAAGIEKLGLPTVQLRSAEEAIIALRQLKEGSPLLCIVDIQLVGLKTGWDFISALHHHPMHHQVPVIVSTVLEPPRNYKDKIPEKYLQKPFSVEQLIELVEQLLQRDQQNATTLIFPMQDERIITSSIQNKGIEVEDITVKEDLIEIQAKRHVDL